MYSIFLAVLHIAAIMNSMQGNQFQYSDRSTNINPLAGERTAVLGIEWAVDVNVGGRVLGGMASHHDQRPDACQPIQCRESSTWLRH